MTHFTRLTLALSLLAACTGRVQDEPSRPIGEQLEGMLLSRGSECEKPEDCASGICDAANCVSLLHAGQTWMEEVIAERLATLLREEPAALALLREDYLPALLAEDKFTRARLAGLLGHLGEPSLRPLLEALLQRTEEPRVSRRAAIELGRSGDPAALDTLLALARGRSEPARLAAMEVLPAYLDGPRGAAVLRTLLDALNSDAYRIRRRAVRLLGRSGKASPAVIGALEDLLRQEGEGFLHHEAYRALARLAPERAERALELVDRR